MRVVCVFYFCFFVERESVRVGESNSWSEEVWVLDKTLPKPTLAILRKSYS